MTLETFAAEMAARGCVPAGRTFCGVYEGRPFWTIFTGGAPGGKTIFVLRMKFGANAPGKLFKAVSNDFKQQTAAFGSPAKLRALRDNSGQYVASVTVASDAEFGRVFDTLLVALVRAAAGLGLSIPQNCPVCKQPGCDSFALHGGAYVPVHGACVRAAAQNKVAKAYDNENNGNYALGALGAVLGGIVGVIPTILLAVFAERISGYLCALIPLGAYFGYKLLRGRMNMAALVTTIIVSLVLCPVTYYLTQDLGYYNETGMLVGPAVFLQLFAEYPGDFVPGLLQVLLFVGIGVFVVFGIVSRGNKHVVQESGASVSTLRPMN